MKLFAIYHDKKRKGGIYIIPALSNINGFTVKLCPIGGRVISINMDHEKCGTKDHQFCDADEEIIDFRPEKTQYANDMLNTPRECLGWEQIGLGGGRAQIAPQILYGTVKDADDNDVHYCVPFKAGILGEYSVRPWTVKGRDILMESPICADTGLSISRKIKLMARTNAFVMESWLTNYTDRNKNVAPWDVLQVRRPYKMRIGPLANIPEASKIFDDPFRTPGFLIERGGRGKYLTMNMDAEDLPQFKLELSMLNKNNKLGTMTAWFHNKFGQDIMLSEIFMLRQPPFPDGESQAQIYFNKNEQYVEMEVTGRLAKLAPNHTSDPVMIMCNYGYARPVVEG